LFGLPIFNPHPFSSPPEEGRNDRLANTDFAVDHGKNVVRRPRLNGVNISPASVLPTSFRSCFCFGEKQAQGLHFGFSERIIPAAGRRGEKNSVSCQRPAEQIQFNTWREI